MAKWFKIWHLICLGAELHSKSANRAILECNCKLAASREAHSSSPHLQTDLKHCRFLFGSKLAPKFIFNLTESASPAARRDSYLGFLAEVGGQFEAGDASLVVAHDDDRVDGVELDVRQHSLLPGHHHLLADGLVFVDAEVKNVNLRKRKETLKGISTLNSGFSVFMSVQ